MIVAIDALSGAGKGQVADAVALARGMCRLESGVAYRAFALACLMAEADMDDERVCAAAIASAKARLVVSGIDTFAVVFGKRCSASLHSSEVDAGAARVAVHGRVRHLARLAVERESERVLERCSGIVVCGRDVGRVVFPWAEVKVWLDARPRVRAQRRVAERFGEAVRFLSADDARRAVADELCRLMRRDRGDCERRFGAARPAKDAVRVDVTHLDTAQARDRVLSVVDALAVPAAS